MTHNKEAIIEFAKELYLTPNEQGNHKYTLRDICSEIKQKFSKNLTNPTILNWARKYGWDSLWKQAVKEGITEAIGGKIDKNRTLDEQYQEAIAKRNREDFIIATNLKTIGYKYIATSGFVSAFEALKAIDVGMKYTQDISEIGLLGKSLADELLALLVR